MLLSLNLCDVVTVTTYGFSVSIHSNIIAECILLCCIHRPIIKKCSKWEGLIGLPPVFLVILNRGPWQGRSMSRTQRLSKGPSRNLFSCDSSSIPWVVTDWRTHSRWSHLGQSQFSTNLTTTDDYYRLLKTIMIITIIIITIIISNNAFHKSQKS